MTLQGDKSFGLSNNPGTSHFAPKGPQRFAYEQVINEICDFDWANLSTTELTNVGWAYYYFSTQFRECLEVARGLYPDDDRLLQLEQGERDTDNLSPWPGVAKPGEKMHHDEFMRRTLELEPISDDRRRNLVAIGQSYLTKVHSIDANTKALALASYEDGGLERVFEAILKAKHWSGPLLQAFKHFLVEHIRFDSDPDQGHGALCRHLIPDDRILPLWVEFRQILTKAAPGLRSRALEARNLELAKV
jgi:hypothetical protein